MTSKFNPYEVSITNNGAGVPVSVGRVSGVTLCGAGGALGLAAGAHSIQDGLGFEPSPVIDGAAGAAGLLFGVRAGDALSKQNPSKSFALFSLTLAAISAPKLFADYGGGSLSGSDDSVNQTP